MGFRTDKAFTDIVDIYIPDTGQIDANKRGKGVIYSDTPDYTDVPCRIEPASEVSNPTVAGRASHDVRLTTDKIRVLMSVDLDDTYYVQLKTASHPEYLSWFVVTGSPIHLNWKAGTKVLYIKREKTPRRIS